jgi:RNA recognition motif-containing protein
MSCCAADGRSVYVKNLPMNITVAELEEELSKYGLVKGAFNDGMWSRYSIQPACVRFV